MEIANTSSKLWKNVGHISEQVSKYSQGGQLSVWFCAFGPLFIHRMEFLTRNMGLKFLCRKRGPTTPNLIQTWTIQTVYRFEMLTKYDTNIMKYIDWHIKGRNQNLTYSFRQRENYLVNYLSSILIILVIW